MYDSKEDILNQEFFSLPFYLMDKKERDRHVIFALFESMKIENTIFILFPMSKTVLL